MTRPPPKLSYAELRRRLQEWPKHPGCRKVPRAPLITPGFPGDFNLSFTEHHWLAEYGRFVDWEQDCILSTVQSCVRLNDLPRVAGPSGWQYLGVFEMADLAGEVALRDRPDYGVAYAAQAAEVVRFLGELGIGPERIHVSYCSGGSVRHLTRGQFSFDFDVPPDTQAREAFLAAGLPAQNLIPDDTRDCFLSLHLHRPTPWGYRNEIGVEVAGPAGPALLDVGTGETLRWQPTFRGNTSQREDLVGLEPGSNGYFGVSFGVERLAMAVNGLARIHEVDSLAPFYAGLRERLGRPLNPDHYRAGEMLRVLHRIVTDRDHHPEAVSLSRRRRRKLSALKRALPRLPETALHDLLKRHAAGQPWHPHLEAAIPATLAEILAYRSAPGVAPRS